LPKIYSHSVNPTTSLAIWHIIETEDFFLEKVPIKSNITHPHKRLQHLAGRYLLQEIVPGFPMDLIRIADTRKPYIKGDNYHFSISHCGNFAAAIVSTTHRVGIDIEKYTERMVKILHKYLSSEEQSIVNRQWSVVNDKLSMVNSKLPIGKENFHWLTLLWCVKEAVYKWFGNGEMGFIQHMQVTKIEGATTGKIEMDFLRNPTPERVSIDYELMGDFALAWILS
jgi:phosphopantetheinyl transferase